MSYPVPCTGVQIGNGKPPSSVTPRSKPSSRIAIRPWSWYIVSTASNSPRYARRKMLSAANGPSARMPRPCAARIAGEMISISSRPNAPSSPACGLSAATAMRGGVKPASRSAACVSFSAPTIASTVSSDGICAIGTWDVTRAHHTRSAMSNSLTAPNVPSAPPVKRSSSS